MSLRLTQATTYPISSETILSLLACVFVSVDPDAAPGAASRTCKMLELRVQDVRSGDESCVKVTA